MKEVTQQHFFKVIGPQNVHPQPQAHDKYRTSLWKTPIGSVKGKSVSGDHTNKWKSKFYLPI